MTLTSQPWPIWGHEWAVQQLEKALQHDRLHHAYLLTGPASIGKTTLAKAFAMRINCLNANKPCGECRACKMTARNTYPDFTIVEAERVGGTLKIDNVRDLQRTLALRPYEAQYRVAILRRFHEANAATQNAILKTLEEPGPNVVMILTVENVDRILPTILSRCQVMNLRPLSLQLTQQALEYAPYAETAENIDHDLLARLSGGRLGWALRVLQDPLELEDRNEALALLAEVLESRTRVARFAIAEKLAKDKVKLQHVLDYWLTLWRDLMLTATGSAAPIINIDYQERLQQWASFTTYGTAHHALEATRQAIKDLGKNANTRLLMEVLLLRYP